MTRLAAMLGQAEGARPTLHLSSGEDAELPAELVELLREAAQALARGATHLHVVPDSDELTTRQAAELLGVSRPHLIYLLERDGIPYRFVGTHRRIPADALLAYKRRVEERALTAFQEMVDLTDEAGLYEAERRAAGIAQ